jgi:isopentenyl diphosphate isomerase/L-lactate dehydrogenase-like FMN-dependent dehydrogenase
MSTSILGEKIQVPFCIAPTGMHKFAHPEGELATAKGWYIFKKAVRYTQ